MKAMDIQPSGAGQTAHFLSLISVIFGGITWTAENADIVFKGITTLVTIVTAVFACRYYYYSAKEKKSRK